MCELPHTAIERPGCQGQHVSFWPEAETTLASRRGPVSEVLLPRRLVARHPPAAIANSPIGPPIALAGPLIHLRPRRDGKSPPAGTARAPRLARFWGGLCGVGHPGFVAFADVAPMIAMMGTERIVNRRAERRLPISRIIVVDPMEHPRSASLDR
jgi:hypothetical protein